MPKYIYTVILDVMEKTYLDNAQVPFFFTDEERNAFNAELVINAETEAQAERIRVGMTDTRMWELNRTE